MAIGESKMHKMLRRRRLLSDAVIWFETFDTDLKVQILDWIRKDQLLAKGVDATGEIIGTYSLTTSLINPQKRYGSPFTLNDKGDFFRSMFVAVLLDEIKIDANSASFAEMKLQDWYTDEILGLTDENLQKLKKRVEARYLEAIKKALSIN